MSATTPRPEPTVVASDERSNGDSPDRVIDVARWARLATDALRTEGAIGELTLTFIDSDDIAELNFEHMGKHGPTDVLSFPLDDESMPTQLDDEVPLLLGDIVVSPAIADTQYVDHAGTFDDEIALLVVHGVLHILGHDHVEPDETALMRERELALLIEHHWDAMPPIGFRQIHND